MASTSSIVNEANRNALAYGLDQEDQDHSGVLIRLRWRHLRRFLLDLADGVVEFLQPATTTWAATLGSTRYRLARTRFNSDNG